MSELNLRLHPRQGDAFLTEATELLYGGAAGGGKSHLMRIALIVWASSCPGLRCGLLRRLSEDLYANHMDGPTGFLSLLHPWTLSGYCKINYSKGKVIFANSPSGGFEGGSQIKLGHCQLEKHKYKYQGDEFHVLAIDEVQFFTQTQYKFLRGRVRMADAVALPPEYVDRFPRIINGANPGGPGHTWVKADFIDIAPPGEVVQMPPEEGGMKRQFIPARLEDNPSLLEHDPGYVDRLHGLGDPSLVKAMREGDWDVVAGAFFGDLWDRSRHVIGSWTPPEGWPCFRSFDWGSSKPFSVGWWTISDGTKAPDGRFYPRNSYIRFAEWYGCEKQGGKIRPNVGLKLTAREVARGILEREENFKGRNAEGERYTVTVYPGPADPSIFSGDDEGLSIADKMEDEGVDWEEGENARLPGWEEMRERLKGDPDRGPTLYVQEHCTDGFLRTVPTIQRSETKPDDVDTEAEDHAADEARYGCMFPGPVIPSGRTHWK